MFDRVAHWEDVYRRRKPDEVSWYQADPRISVELIEACGGRGGSVLDVGAGASRVVDTLLERGYSDITLLDVSEAALAHAKSRLSCAQVQFLVADITSWRPERSYEYGMTARCSTS